MIIIFYISKIYAKLYKNSHILYVGLDFLKFK